MASPSTVITLGFGSFGSVNLVPTLGYGSEESVVLVYGPIRVVAAMVSRPGVKAAEVYRPGVMAAETIT